MHLLLLCKTKVENVSAIYFKTNIQIFFVLVYFVRHTAQFKMLVFAFESEIWIAQNLNFTVFEDFCLSLSWKCRFSQNVNHTKVQSKTNKYCKFHVDLTRRRLSKSQFKKLAMVPKKLYRNTLNMRFFFPCKWGLFLNAPFRPRYCVCNK